MASLKYLLVIILGLLSVVGGVEEHGDPKEHARREGKSKSSLKKQIFRK